MDKELLQALGNININSESAVQIAEQYIMFKYVDSAMAFVLLFGIFVIMPCVVVKILKIEVD